MHFSWKLRHEKCLKNLDFKNQGIFRGFSGFFEVEKGIFKSPLLCPHPLPSFNGSHSGALALKTENFSNKNGCFSKARKMDLLKHSCPYVSRVSFQGPLLANPFFSVLPKRPIFFTQISGRNFLPELCGYVHAETVPLQALGCAPCSTEKSIFREAEKGENGAEKRGGRGLASKGCEKEKRTCENRSENDPFFYWNSRF